MIKIIGLDQKVYDEIMDQIGPVLTTEWQLDTDTLLNVYDVLIRPGVRCMFSVNNEEDGAIDFIFTENKRYKLFRDSFFEIQIF